MHVTHNNTVHTAVETCQICNIHVCFLRYSLRFVFDACQWVNDISTLIFAFHMQLFYNRVVQRPHFACSHSRGRVRKVELYVWPASGQWPGIPAIRVDRPHKAVLSSFQDVFPAFPFFANVSKDGKMDAGRDIRRKHEQNNRFLIFPDWIV